VVLGAATVHAYEPIGTQQRLSTTGTDGFADRDAFEPAIAYNGAANEFLVVWSSDHASNDEHEIFGQRVGPTGAPIGDDFVISETGPTAGDPARNASSPDVTYNSVSNEYLVVWEGDDETLVDNEFEIHGQVVTADGTPNGINFPISDQGPPDDDASIWAVEPAVTYNLPQNRYLAVWRGGAANGTGDFEIYGQQLNQLGGEVGTDDFPISDAGTIATGDRQPEDPDVAYGSVTDEYLVTWDGDGLATDNEYEIFGQRLNTTGGEVGTDDFRISQTGTDTDVSRAAIHPAVAYGSGPNEFLVTWFSDPFPLDDEIEIFGQRVSGAGAEVGVNDFRISTTGADGVGAREAYEPAIAYSPTGNEYLVAWTGNPEPLPLSKYETNAQRLSATGGDIGADFRVSTTASDANATQIAEAAALAYGVGPNAYLSAWEGEGLATDGELEIFGRLIGKPAATTDPAGNANPATPTTCPKPKKKKKKKRAALAKKKKKKKKGCGKKKKKRKKK
jgi:hypothetical protein